MSLFTIYFCGEPIEFRSILEDIEPHYQIPNSQCYQFRSIGGGTVLWWPTTGACHVRGKKAIREAYLKKIKLAIAKRARNSRALLLHPDQVKPRRLWHPSRIRPYNLN